jgi:hypothetical protein
MLITPSFRHPDHDASSPRTAGRTRSVFDHTPHRLLAGFLFACVAVWAEPPACRGMTISEVGAPMVLLPPRAFGLKFFPDGSMFHTTIDGKSYYFAASGGGARSGTQGTIVLTGTPHDLTPLIRDARGMPVPGLSPGAAGGGAAASGFGRDFDRDYAAGGPVLFDPRSGALLHMYHAEYHFVPDKPAEFYSSLGLAISSDKGRSFRKLGLVIRPALPPEEGVRTPSSSGSLVVRPPYVYVYYSDISADRTCDGQPSGNLPCVAVARAKLTDVLSQAAHGAAQPWLKYHQGDFTEPGDGGVFSPLFVTPAATWPRWPDVIFEPKSKYSFMVYAAGDRGLELRDSTDGLHWSEPTRIMTFQPDQVVNYPSIVEVTNPSGSRLELMISYVIMPKDGGRIDFTSRSLMAVAVRQSEP